MKRAISRKKFVLFAIAAAIWMLLAPWAAAGSLKRYEKPAFQAARNSGQPVVLVFHASWCPICAQQKTVLTQAAEEKEFEKVQVFLADFDSSTELKKEMGVASQSTLVLFRSGRELGRLIGDTDPDEIRRFLRKGLK